MQFKGLLADELCDVVLEQSSALSRCDYAAVLAKGISLPPLQLHIAIHTHYLFLHLKAAHSADL